MQLKISNKSSSSAGFKIGSSATMLSSLEGRIAAKGVVMKLHGSIIDNLESAVASSRRLRGHPVYPDTLNYWRELLHEGRHVQRNRSYRRRELLEAAIARLDVKLADRAEMIEPLRS